jgi:predicted amidohydrolase YtcJ
VLKIGRRADVTVVDRDLFRIPPEDLLKVKVRMTVIDGEPVYESDGR